MSDNNTRKNNAKKNKLYLGYGVAAVLVIMAGVSFFTRDKSASSQDTQEPEIIYAEEEMPDLTYNGDFGYYSDDDGIVIAAYNGSDTSLSIPAEMEGRPVYQIADNVFSERADLTNVTLPDTLRVIGTSAFANCTSLKEITIPANVTWTGPYAFFGDSAMETLVIEPGEEIAIIGYFAFSGCSSLKSVVIPANYRQIDTRAFSECTSLETFTWESNEAGDTDQDIGGFVFDGCTALTEIHLKGNILDIEDANGYTNSNFTIYAPEGSLAIDIAKENHLDYEIEEN